jgi:lysozyme family protein
MDKAFFNQIVEREGRSVTNVKGDAGGLTNTGITYRFYNDNCKNILGLNPSLEHFNHLTDDELFKLYDKKFWQGLRANEISSQKVGEFIVDFAINSQYAVRQTQRLLNDVYKFNLDADNSIGNQTIRAINEAISRGEELFYCRLKLARIEYVNNISFNDLVKNPNEKRILQNFDSDIKFLNGWIFRILGFK